MVVTGDHCLHVAHLAHSHILARIEDGRGGLFAPVAYQKAGLVAGIAHCLIVFGNGDVLEHYGRHRFAAVFLCEIAARLPVPLNLVAVDIAPAVYARHIVAVAAVKQVEHPVHAAFAGEGQYVVRAVGQPQVVGGVYVAGYRAEHLENFCAGQLKIAVVVAQRHCKRDFPVHQWLQYLAGGCLCRGSEHHISCKNHKVRLFGIQHLYHILHRSFRAGITGNVVGVGKLQYLELSVLAILEFFCDSHAVFTLPESRGDGTNSYSGQYHCRPNQNFLYVHSLYCII